MSDRAETLSRDEQRLAEMGYKQSLNRAWSGFSNFAISFTIISVLAGCFTTYGQAWNNGGPIAITWGWPIISAFILIVALSMSELVSKYPTAGAIYWWSSEMGGRVWGWFTGWFNMIGLIGVVASVDYACATFLNAVLGLYKVNFIFNFGDDQHILRETFVLFVVILALHALINIFQTQLLALFNNISVWVHVAGVAVIVAILAFVPDTHQSFDFVFTKRINNSGFSGGMFWFYILPLGFLLTQYTITGFDASAHISEETKDAEQSAARGVWRSVFYSALIGWIVLIAITFAATDVKAINDGAGSSLAVFDSALTPAAAKAVILISTIGQFFCGMACLTSASRMFYAFSRDRAVPGNRMWTRLTQRRVPAYAVLMVALLALLITLPALHGDENAFPFAFFAVVSITVIGLYIAYAIPIFLRWRMGDKFQPASWTLGKKYKWMNAIAVGEVALVTVIFCLPFTPAAVPWNDGFKWEAFNYAPLTVGLVLIGAWLGWIFWAKKHWPGHVREVDPFGEGTDIRPEVPATPPAEPQPGTAPA